MSNSSPLPAAAVKGDEGTPAAVPAPPAPRKDLRAARWVVSVVLAASVLLAYQSVYDEKAQFLDLDDGDYVGENPHVKDGLTLKDAGWAFTTFYAANWHPLVWLSLQLDHDWYGMNAWGYHLTNVLLHLANSVLLFLLLERMTKALWRSALVAALFALHPLHVESVAWVSERKDVLSTLFWLLTMAAYHWYVQRPSLSRYLLVAVAFALGLMSKPMLVTLPFVLLLLDWWPLGRLQTQNTETALNSPICNLQSAILEKLPLLVMAGAVAVATMLAQGVGEKPLMEHLSFPLRLVSAGLAHAEYLRKTVWPSDLAPLYSRPHDKLPVVAGTVALAGVIVVTILLFWSALRMHRRDKVRTSDLSSPCHPLLLSPLPPLLVGWLWFVGTLVPVIGLVPVGIQTMADRYTYLPHIGLFIGAVWGLAALLAGRVKRGIQAVLAGGVLVACFLLTSRQAELWQDGLKIWERAVQVTEDNFAAHDTFGVTLQTRGRDQEAIEQFRIGLRIEPKNAKGHYNIGFSFAAQARALEQRRKWQEAQAKWSEAADRFAAAVQVAPDARLAVREWAAALMHAGRNHEAVAPLTRLANLAPGDPIAHFNLAHALFLSGRDEEAADEAAKVLKIDPLVGEAHKLLGELSALKALDAALAAETGEKPGFSKKPRFLDLTAAIPASGQPAVTQADTHFRAALSVGGVDKTVIFYLAWCRLAQGHAQDAPKLFHEAVQHFPAWPDQHRQEAWQLATDPDPTRRNGRLALLRAEVAYHALGSDNAAALDTLAAAYAECARFEGAVAAARLALAAAPEGRKSAIEARLKLYEAGRPFHAERR